MKNDNDNIGWLSVGIFVFFIGLTALSQDDIIFGIGILFISLIFFVKI